MLLYVHRSYFISKYLICILEYIYINFIYDILFLNILCGCNTFSYTSKNILLVIVILFSVFLRPYEHLQVLNVCEK
jgi:hypothetical protein